MTFPTIRFYEALQYAGDLHRHQKRKGTNIPYLSHLLGVASIAIDHGADEEIAIAALLHDSVEDAGGDATGNEVRRRFGDRVARIVYACTDTAESPKPPWLERKKAYLNHLEQLQTDELLVSMADKLHNLTAIYNDYLEVGDKVWDRFSAEREGVIWYYQSLAECYQKHPEVNPSLLQKLNRVLLNLQAAVNNSK